MVAGSIATDDGLFVVDTGVVAAAPPVTVRSGVDAETGTDTACPVDPSATTVIVVRNGVFRVGLLTVT
jgi:hypothetical protein